MDMTLKRKGQTTFGMAFIVGNPIASSKVTHLLQNPDFLLKDLRSLGQ